MTFTEAKREYCEALRKNRKLPAPRVAVRTPEGIREWKNRIRAFDVARIELGIKTAQEVQQENTAVKVPRGPYRIIRHERYV